MTGVTRGMISEEAVRMVGFLLVAKRRIFATL